MQTVGCYVQSHPTIIAGLKRIYLIAISILVCFSIAIGGYFFMSPPKTNTPTQFLNGTTLPAAEYVKDTAEIANQLRVLLAKHTDFFENSAYFPGTQIIIDTVLYSPDFKKVAILFITKNPTSRQLIPDPNSISYYDGTVYLGLRVGNSVKLSWLGPNFSNSIDKAELSRLLRNECFIKFAGYTTEAPVQKYNLNDTRFWNSDEWISIE
jgi:hypothetical protein